MPRIRLLLGRQHRHRHRFRREQAIQDDSIGSVRQAMHNGTNPGIPTASDSGCLVDPHSHPVFGRFSVPKKEVMSSVSNAGCLVDPDSHPVFGRFSVPKKEVVSSVSNAVTVSASQFTFGTLGGPSRSISLRAGLSIGCVSLAMASPLAYNAKSCGIPFLSLSVTAAVPQFISGTLGGPFRSISAHAGTHNLDNCYDDGPFKIEIGDTKELNDRISIEKNDTECKIRDFENRYNELVRPLLGSRCLVAPEDLTHPSTVFLHRQTFQFAHHNPNYVSCFDIMAHEQGMTDDEWKMFLDHLVKKKVYVIEKWDLSISKIQILMYDHGLVPPQDDSETDFCKGECDASYEAGSASLAFIIWRGDKIIYSEIYKNVECGSVTEAELFAAFALLSKSKELGIQKMLLCSDCVTVCDILSGEHCIEYVKAPSPEEPEQNNKASSSASSLKEHEQNKKSSASSLEEYDRNKKASSSVSSPEDSDQKKKAASSSVSSPEDSDQNKKAAEEYRQLVLYLMLRSMKRHFKNLVPMWKPRELMVFPDDLAKANEVVVGDPQFPGHAMQKWSYHLKGLPLFRIEWTHYTKKKIAKFGKFFLDESYGQNTDRLFHIKVEDHLKFDCLSGIIQAFGTIKLSLFVNNIPSKIKRYPGFCEDLKRFVRISSENRLGVCSLFANLRDEAADKNKNLVIIFDADIPRELYYKDNAYHIIFVIAKEQNLIDEMKILELNAISFVHFHGVRYPLNDPDRKDKGEKNKQKGCGTKGMLVSSTSKSGRSHH